MGNPMDWLNNGINNLQGNLSPEQLRQLGGMVQGPSQGAYQTPGLSDYTQQMGGLQQQVPGAPDVMGATQPGMDQQQALQTYLQSVALGQQPTAADAMFQQGQQSAARNLQSGMVSAQGMNPAMQMRQMFNSQAANAGMLAGQSAQQKLQQQEQYAGMAQHGGAQMFNQQMQRTQQDFHNRMANVQAQKDIADGIFSANRFQGTMNAEYDKNRQAFQMFQQEQQKQAMMDQNKAHAAFARALINGGLTAGGMAIGGAMGGPMGAMAGGQLGSSVAQGFTGGGGGGSSMSPAMMAMLMQRGGGGGQAPVGSSGGDMFGGTPGSFREGYDVYGNTPSGMPGGDAMGYGTGVG